MQYSAMSDRPWWAAVLQWTLWAVAMSLVMAWLARSRMRPAAQSRSGTELRNPTSVLILGVVCSGFFGALAAWSYGSPSGGPRIALFFVLFALLGVYLIYAYVTDWNEVRSDGVAFKSVRRGMRFAAWDEIVEITYTGWAQWLVLRLRDGTRFRLSMLVVGAQIAADALLRNVEGDVINKDAREMLERASRGDLPRLW
jgi:hypothetical protein